MANTITKHIVSFKIIYNRLYFGIICNENLSKLKHKGKRQKSYKTRGKFSVRTPISKRIKEAKNRR